MVYWITGKKNSGKTTLAEKIKQTLENHGQPSCVLDGDEIRDELGDTGYTFDGRMANINRVVGIARILHRQGIVPIIALVSPYKKLMDVGFESFPSMRLIYCEGGELWEGSYYEIPRYPFWIHDWSFPYDKIALKLGLP